MEVLSRTFVGLGGLSSRAKGHSSRRKDPLHCPVQTHFPRRGHDIRGVLRILSSLEEGAPQTFNPSHSLSCGPTVCLRTEDQVLLRVGIHSPGGSRCPPTPQIFGGLPYPQRAPQLQAQPFTGLSVPGILRPPLPGAPTRSLGVGVCAPGRGRIPGGAPPPAPAVWPHAGSSPQSRGRSGRG